MKKRNIARPKAAKSQQTFPSDQMEVLSMLLLDEKASVLQTVANILIEAGKAVEAAAEKIRRSH